MSDLSTVLVFCMIGLLLLQTGGLLVALIRLDRGIRRSQKSLIKANSALRRTLRGTGEMLERMGGLADRLPALAAGAGSFIDSLGGYLEELDEKAASGLATVTRKVEEGGRKFEYAVSQFSRQTTRLSRSVHYPAARISALLKGIRAGLRAYREKDLEAPLQDEEIFI